MEQLYALIDEKSKDKLAGSHRVAAQVVAGMIRGSKYWTLEMVRMRDIVHIFHSAISAMTSFLAA
jgi:hypothetical protein